LRRSLGFAPEGPPANPAKKNPKGPCEPFRRGGQPWGKRKNLYLNKIRKNGGGGGSGACGVRVPKKPLGLGKNWKNRRPGFKSGGGGARPLEAMWPLFCFLCCVFFVLLFHVVCLGLGKNTKFKFTFELKNVGVNYHALPP